MSTKFPNVAGLFYPDDPKQLDQMLRQFFARVNETPTTVQFSPVRYTLRALVAPHAGYIYSGPTAAYGYKILQTYLAFHQQRTQKNTHVFVILSPSHYAYIKGVSVGLYDTFAIPGAEISVCKDLCNELITTYPTTYAFIEAAFAKEHALEVHLPFLHSIATQKSISFCILPLIIGCVNAKQVAEQLDTFFQKHKDDFAAITYIVSSDLSHYLPYEVAQHVDKQTLDAFLAKDLEAIKQKADACGITPWTILTELAKRNDRQPYVLDYKTSGDTAGSKASVVGYASVGYFAHI